MSTSFLKNKKLRYDYLSHLGTIIHQESGARKYPDTLLRRGE
jgi:hypothetical protein